MTKDKRMLTYPIKIEGLKGVGSVELNLKDDQRAYALIAKERSYFTPPGIPPPFLLHDYAAK